MSLLPRRKREDGDSVRAKAKKRLGRLQTVDILNWADQAGSGVAKALDDYRRIGTSESLEEARIGLESLLGLVEVLQEREHG